MAVLVLASIVDVRIPSRIVASFTPTASSVVTTRPKFVGPASDQDNLLGLVPNPVRGQYGWGRGVGRADGVIADKGERMWFCSDVLPFAQMSEQVNQLLSLAGKIPSGVFYVMFDYRGCWHRDIAATRGLCFDGNLVELYSIEVVRVQLTMWDHVKRDVPPC
jgi:hypothetical protein